MRLPVRRQAFALAVSVVLVLGVLGSMVLTAHGAAPTVTKIALPSGATPVGLVYSAGFVYYASYTYGAIYKVNASTHAYTYLRGNDSSSFDHDWYGMAVDGSGNLWLTRAQVASNGTLGGLSVVSPSGVETRILTGGNQWDGVVVSRGFAYTATQTTLYQVNATSHAQTTFPISAGGGSYAGFVADSSGNIWFSDVVAGKVCELTGSVLSCHPGFSRPLGISIVGGFGYVAQNNPNGGFEKFNLTSGAIVQDVSITGTTPYAAGVSGTSPVWTSSGSDDKVCVVGPTALSTTCTSTGEENYYVVNDSQGNLFVSYFGSSGIAEIQGLQPTSTTTTVQTVTFTQTVPVITTVTTLVGTQTQLAIATVTTTIGTVTSTVSSSSSSSSCQSASVTTPKYSVGQTFLASDGKCYTAASVNFGSLANVAGCQSTGWWYYTTSGAELTDVSCAGEWVPYAT